MIKRDFESLLLPNELARVELLLQRKEETIQSVNSSSRAINENSLSWLLRPHRTIVSVESRPFVTVILFAGPLLSGKPDICDIPNEKTREPRINLTGKFDQTSLKKLTSGVDSSIKLIVDDRSDLFSAEYLTLRLK